MNLFRVELLKILRHLAHDQKLHTDIVNHVLNFESVIIGHFYPLSSKETFEINAAE